ncbi:MAG: hypothetical protein HRT54_12060 [Colwellia sp.]|nr:hypothetical protein [Colwellia sp.]
MTVKYLLATAAVTSASLMLPPVTMADNILVVTSEKAQLKLKDGRSYYSGFYHFHSAFSWVGFFDTWRISDYLSCLINNRVLTISTNSRYSRLTEFLIPFISIRFLPSAQISFGA